MADNVAELRALRVDVAGVVQKVRLSGDEARAAIGLGPSAMASSGVILTHAVMEVVPLPNVRHLSSSEVMLQSVLDRIESWGFDDEVEYYSAEFAAGSKVVHVTEGRVSVAKVARPRKAKLPSLRRQLEVFYEDVRNFSAAHTHSGAPLWSGWVFGLSDRNTSVFVLTASEQIEQLPVGGTGTNGWIHLIPISAPSLPRPQSWAVQSAAASVGVFIYLHAESSEQHREWTRTVLWTLDANARRLGAAPYMMGLHPAYNMMGIKEPID